MTMALLPRSQQSFCQVLAIFTLLLLSTRKVRLEAIKVVPQFMSSTEFIRTSCGATLYPDICFKTLSTYSATIRTSQLELTSAALNVSLRSAESTWNLVSKLSKEQQLTAREAGALTDCLENMENSVDELKGSLLAMRDLEGADFELEKSNIQTWVSAALTEEDTCLDGFVDQNVIDEDIKGLIRTNIVRVGQLTSNALALVNRLSRPSRIFHSP